MLKEFLVVVGSIAAIPCTYYLARFVLRLPCYYLASLIRALGREPDVVAAVTEQRTGSRARLSYFSGFRGPAWADFAKAASKTADRVNSLVAGGLDDVGSLRELRQPSPDRPALRQDLRLGLRIPPRLWLACVLPGILAGLALCAAVAAIYAVSAAVATVSVAVAAVVLKVIDSVVTRIRNVRMTCPDPSCGYGRVRFPGYACPNCGEPHKDIRPSRYGVFQYHCHCGQLLPTTLRRASARLTAFCPAPAHDKQDNELMHRPGEAPEIVVPFLGASGAGKTRLMHALATLIRWTPGLHAEFADPATRARLAYAEWMLAPGAELDRTQAALLPRGYLLRIGRGRLRRVLQLFDASGERFYHAGRTRELGYLAHARTFVLVIDPLAVAGVRQGLSAVRRPELEREEAPAAGLIYERVHPLLKSMGVRLDRTRIAVVISHADQLAVPEGEQFDEWAACELDLGNLIRSAGLQFAEVKLFSTASVVEHGVMDPSIARLARWLLGRDAGAEIADKTGAIAASGPTGIARPELPLNRDLEHRIYRWPRRLTFAWICGCTLGLTVLGLIAGYRAL